MGKLKAAWGAKYNHAVSHMLIGTTLVGGIYRYTRCQVPTISGRIPPISPMADHGKVGWVLFCSTILRHR